MAAMVPIIQTVYRSVGKRVYVFPGFFIEIWMAGFNQESIYIM